MRIRSRRSWRAQKPRGTVYTNINQRTGFYVHHSVTSLPADYFDLLEISLKHPKRRQRRKAKRACVSIEKEHMRYLQAIAFGRGFSDVSYNFIGFPSGRFYVGRGWTKVGAHNDGENTATIGACAVGNYEVAKPTNRLVGGFAKLYRHGVTHGHIKRGSFIKGHRQSDATACPGKNLYAKLPHIRNEAGL